MKEQRNQEEQFNPDTGLWESKYWLPSVTGDAAVFGYDEAEDGLRILLIQRVRNLYN